MSFLKKIKKTLMEAFFGKPEPRKKKKKSSSSAVKNIKKSSSKKIVAPPKKVKPKLRMPSKAKIAKPKIQVKKKQKSGSKPKKATVKKRRIPPAKASAKLVKDKVPGVLIGHVTHFFPQVNAAAIKIEVQNISVGDELYFKGATTNFKLKILSMQINRLPVTRAEKGAEVGILVKKRVREGDEVYRVTA